MVITTGGFNNLDSSKSNQLESRLLTAIARSAEDLTTGKGWPDGVNELLRDLGQITNVSRVWIFQTLELESDHILQDYAFEWASKSQYIQIGSPSFNRFTSDTNQSEYASLIESRRRGEYQHLITEQLPESWLKGFLSSQHILSMLTIPIFVEDRWWGTLGFDDCERAQSWSSSEIALLRTASFLISSAVLRDSLSTKRKQLEILKKITDCSVWELDVRRGHLWCTPEVFSHVQSSTDTLHFSFLQCLGLVHQTHRRYFIQLVRKFLQERPNSLRFDLKIKTEGSGYRWVEVSAKIDRTGEKKEEILAGILLDISVRKEAEERLRYEATTDPLTGVYNRRKIESLVQEQVVSYRENQTSFSLLVMDLDYFKRVNDTYGHAVGDKVLCHFTKTCSKAIRDIDILARIGGEEFAILLPNTTSDEANVISERIRVSVLEEIYLHDGDPIPYTVSIGHSTSQSEFLEVHKIFERADSALYLAKQSGRNQVRMN